MCIFKLTLQIFGDTFHDTLAFEKELMGELGSYDIKAAGDRVQSIRNGKPHEYTLSFGRGYFNHPKIFYQQHVDGLQGDYEEWFIDFSERNYSVFMKYGIDDIQIMIDVFFDKEIGNCNFEIFSKENLKRISDMKIALPISIYSFESKQMLDLLKADNWKL